MDMTPLHWSYAKNGDLSMVGLSTKNIEANIDKLVDKGVFKSRKQITDKINAAMDRVQDRIIENNIDLESVDLSAEELNFIGDEEVVLAMGLPSAWKVMKKGKHRAFLKDQKLLNPIKKARLDRVRAKPIQLKGRGYGLDYDHLASNANPTWAEHDLTVQQPQP